MNVIKYESVQQKIIEIRNHKIIIDSDVAELYGVETKEINQAVSRNPEKFPHDYIFELTAEEKTEVVTNCDHLQKLKFSPNLPKGFTERGLYMLATILKSPQATETTLAIIDTFAEIKELSRTIATIQSLPENSPQQKSMLTRAGEIIADLLIPEDDDLSVEESETSIEIGLPFIRIKRRVKHSRK